MRDFFKYGPGWTILGVIALSVGIVSLAVHHDNAEHARVCHEITALARSTRDSMDARIACAQIDAGSKSDGDPGFAIGIATGMAAGSR